VQFTTSDLEIQIRTSAELGGDNGKLHHHGGRTQAHRHPAHNAGRPDSQPGIEPGQAHPQGRQEQVHAADLPAEDFPLVQERAGFGPVFSVPQKTLKDLLGQVSFAMAVHDIRYYLNGILFVAEGKQLSLVATDGHRLAFAVGDAGVEVPKQEVILPRKTVLEMQRLLSDAEGTIEMQFASNQARFDFGGMEFVTKLVEGKFPDYNRVIPKNHKNSITLGRQRLAGHLAAHRHLTSDKFKGVRLNLDPGPCAWPRTMPSRKKPWMSSTSTTAATASRSVST
jgi:DNA polymerase-3 subunit beta